jgi:type IV secretion/conjugal transfer VirB4 family ATPase
MFNLREYRKDQRRLFEKLPWGALVAPGVVLNKDGSFQRTFKYRGPDLDFATKTELVSTVSRINNVFKRFTGGWVLYADAHRVKSMQYPRSAFPDILTSMMDEERRIHFEKGNHYESHYYLTLVYLPPTDKQGKLKEMLLKRNQMKEETSYEEHKNSFRVEAIRVFRLLAEILPEITELSSDETLTYLHSCISPKRHFVKTPKVPLYLDAVLADTPFLGGIEPKLGKHHLRTISIAGFPEVAQPGLLDNLNRLNFEYRWTTRYIPLDKQDALSVINSYRRKWFANRQSAFQMLQSVFTNSQSSLENSDAVKKSQDSDLAAQEVAADIVSYGYYTMTITVMDESEKRVEKMVRAIEETINSKGFVTITEDINTQDAWFGSLPGLCRANVRRPILNTLNLIDLFPLSALWAGPEANRHLNGPPLIYTQTSGNTPFRFDLHTSGDVGHTLIVGPTGMGKSVILALMAAQARRYPNAQTFFFDKGGSIRALAAGVRGDFFDLGQEGEGAISFQPLAKIDNPNELEWAHEWILQLLENEKLEITPGVKHAMWEALASVQASPPELRTMSTLYAHTMEEKLRQALYNYTSEGPYGRLFDSKKETMTYNRFQVFEMETLISHKESVVQTTLQYLFHRLESYFQSGVPTFLFLDEAWTYLDNPTFVAKIREWLKVLRKKNVAVIFATQSLADIAHSPIAPAIIESCMTKVYLPNPIAKEETTQPIYRSFGLNDKEIDILSMAIGKRQYYFKSSKGNRVFEFALDQCPLALAYCGASSTEDQQMVQHLLATYGKDSFNEYWLRYKNLPEIAKIYQETKVMQLQENQKFG